VDPPLRLTWAERRIVVVHDPKDLAGAIDADVALHGHDHRSTSAWRGDTLVFNPGECAGHLAGHNRVGVVDLLRRESSLLYF
jgi:predicted phosphodiesterase